MDTSPPAVDYWDSGLCPDSSQQQYGPFSPLSTGSAISLRRRRPGPPHVHPRSTTAAAAAARGPSGHRAPRTPGGDRMPAQLYVGRIERDPQLAGIARCLRQDKASLDHRQGGRGQLVGVGAGIQPPAGLHRAQAVADLPLPATKRVRELASRLLVALGELADKGADGASAAGVALDLERDQRFEPLPNRLPAVQRSEVGLLRVEHTIGVVGDDRPKQRGTVLEVVVELALADAGTLENVVEADFSDAPFGNQLGSDLDDAVSRRAAPGRPCHLAHSAPQSYRRSPLSGLCRPIKARPVGCGGAPERRAGPSVAGVDSACRVGAQHCLVRRRDRRGGVALTAYWT